jgi:PleD family two-component response regulator
MAQARSRPRHRSHPRTRATCLAAVPSSRPAQASASPVIDASATVLVVEDNHRLRDIVVKQLTSLGLAVLEAENAQQALERLDGAKTVDLVFSDVVLPVAWTASRSRARS